MRKTSLLLPGILLGGCFLAALRVQSQPAQPASSLQTTMTDDALDPAAFMAWVDGKETKDKLPAEGPAFVLWRQGGQRGGKPEWPGVSWGDTKMPGVRHLRIGFKTPQRVGAVLVRGGGTLSVLKPGAAYPGNMADDTQWIPAQHVESADVTQDEAGRESLVLWTLPEVVETRALRFSHTAKPTDKNYEGWLGGASILSERLVNLAPQAVASTSANGHEAPRINNASNDGTWSQWDNGDNGGAQVVSDENAEWVMLTWPQAVTLRGLIGISTGFGNAEAQIYNGPADRHPREATAADWKTLKRVEKWESGYPLQMWPNAIDFGEPVSTRAVRLRLTNKTVEGHPHLNGNTREGKRVWLGELMALRPLTTDALRVAVLPRTAPAEQPPIPIRFRLPQAGFVTLVIEDETGQRVRNLVSETPFPAGDNTVYWDGSDDLGRDPEAYKRGLYSIPTSLVAPGKYSVRGLYRGPVDLNFEFSIYNSGRPAWLIENGTGGWLTNHTPPSSALYVPATEAPGGKPLMYLGSYVSEGGSGLAWTDMEGRKQGGRGWVGGNWTAAPFLARDAGPNRIKDIYAYVGAAWSADAPDGKAATRGEIRLTGLTAQGDRPILKWTFDPPAKENSKVHGTAEENWGDHLGGFAVRNGLLVFSLKQANQLGFVDVGFKRLRGLASVPNPRGMAFDAQGRLLVLSGHKLLRFNLPPSLAPITQLDSKEWTASANKQNENAAKAIDTDVNSRWSTHDQQRGGEWFSIDMKAPRSLSSIALESQSAQDSPRGYEVAVSDDGTNWKNIATGDGTRGLTLITFPRVTARYLKVTQTKTGNDIYWSINSLNVFDGPDTATNYTLPDGEVLQARLEDPRGITLDAAGNIFVSDGGQSHQVKMFSPAGKTLRVFGKMGTPKAGAYEPLHMNNPKGLSLDANGRLWVTEEDYQPKRVSVWNMDGTLWKAFYGPSEYGGGGKLDPRDPTRFYYHGMEFKLDWKAGTNTLTQVFYRPAEGDLKSPDGWGSNGTPESPVYAQNRQYMTNAWNSNPTNGAPIAMLWQMKNGLSVPVAAMGNARNWNLISKALPSSDTSFSTRWSGQIEPKFSETYTFSTVSDDGVRLWVNGQALIDNWNPHGAMEDKATIALEAGKRYDIRIEYFQTSGGARMQLNWQSPSQPREVIPIARLFADATAKTGTGLRAQYFRGRDLKTEAITRVEGPIDFTWDERGPSLAPPDVAPLAARLPAGIGSRDDVMFAWSDLNGDAQLQPAEVQFRKASSGGVTVGDDLSFDVSRVDEKATSFKPTKFTPAGTPVYDLAGGETLLAGAQSPTSSGGDQVLANSDGWVVSTIAPKPFSQYGVGGARKGANGTAQNAWSYPSLWPGLHASHEAPVPDRPGMLIGTTRLLGTWIKPRGAQVGPLWSVNSNHGHMYLFTKDGLFVATLFRDMRLGKAWAMPIAERNMNVNDQTLHDENFWPSITQTADGRVFLVDGGRTSLIRVDGLDSLRPIDKQTITVSQTDLDKARDYFVRLETRRQAEQGQGTLLAQIRETAPTVDGKMDDWAGASWVDIDKRGVAAYFNSDSKPYDVTGAVAVSGDRLFAAWRVGDANLLRNSGETPNALFKNGGALDLMIGANPQADPKRPQPVAGDMRLLITRVSNKTRALLYRAVVPGTTTPVPFSSPWRTINIDVVEDVTDQVQLASDGGNYEISIPLKTLNLSPQAGTTIKGDIGLLRGNGFQTQQRVYWSNKATAITADVPSEAQLTPQLWGRWEWVQK